MLFDKLCKFNKIVLWGYKESFHSHKFIHLGYAKMLERMGIDYVWVDDSEESNQFISPNDLIMLPDVHLKGSNLNKELSHNFRKDVYYILHPGDFLSEKNWNDLDITKVVRLYEFRNSYIRRLSESGYSLQKLYNFVEVDKKEKIIIQPWGSDLCFQEFLSPVYPQSSDVYFIGTIWGDGEKQGNRSKVEYIEKITKKMGLSFSQRSNLSIEENIKFVRESRVSFSIGAAYHNEDNYLQCRMFKNIAYGQPTITDVQGFKVILENSFVDFIDWDVGFDKIMQLNELDYKDLCLSQQKKIEQYTYDKLWLNMINLFE